MTSATPTGTTTTPHNEVRFAAFHHVNFATTRLDVMRDWYCQVLGMEVTFEFPMGCWMSNDQANHRIALTALPGLVDDPDKRIHSRLHHHAFEYASFDDLAATFERLRELDITPQACLDHGMTISYYYVDPDGNFLELQHDVFGDWAASKAWMNSSLPFAENPIGAFFDPGKVAAAYSAGMSFEEIHRRIWETTDFRTAEPPDMGGPIPGPDDPRVPAKW
jgi:catechol 2,3-dioxygenase